MTSRCLVQPESVVRAPQPLLPGQTQATPHPELRLQAAIGNQAVNRLLGSAHESNPWGQASLPYDSNPWAAPIQAKLSFQGLFQELNPPLAAQGTGKRLPEPVRQKMEGSFGADFSDVRIHEGKEAEGIGATAFTRGHNIHFASGKYNPTNPSGQALLGHELAHVLQQRAGRVVVPQGGQTIINIDTVLEREADAAGVRAKSGEVVWVSGVTPSAQSGQNAGAGVIQLKGDDLSLKNVPAAIGQEPGMLKKGWRRLTGKGKTRYERILDEIKQYQQIDESSWKERLEKLLEISKIVEAKKDEIAQGKDRYPTQSRFGERHLALAELSKKIESTRKGISEYFFKLNPNDRLDQLKELKVKGSPLLEENDYERLKKLSDAQREYEGLTVAYVSLKNPQKQSEKLVEMRKVVEKIAIAHAEVFDKSRGFLGKSSDDKRPSYSEQFASIEETLTQLSPQLLKEHRSELEQGKIPGSRGLQKFFKTLDSIEGLANPANTEEYRDLSLFRSRDAVTSFDVMRMGGQLGKGGAGEVLKVESKKIPGLLLAKKQHIAKNQHSPDNEIDLKRTVKRAVYIPMIAKALGFNHMPLSLSMKGQRSDASDQASIISRRVLGENLTDMAFSYKALNKVSEDPFGVQKVIEALLNVDAQKIQDVSIFDMLFQFQDGHAAQYMLSENGDFEKVDNDEYKLAKGSYSFGHNHYSGSFPVGLPQANRRITKKTLERLNAIDVDNLRLMLESITYKVRDSSTQVPAVEQLFEKEKIERAVHNLEDLKLLIEVGNEFGGLSTRELFNFYNSRDEQENLDLKKDNVGDFAEKMKRTEERAYIQPSDLYNMFGTGISKGTNEFKQRMHEELGASDRVEQKKLASGRRPIDKAKFIERFLKRRGEIQEQKKVLAMLDAFIEELDASRQRT